MSEAAPIRVALVDDHTVVREGFAALIALEPGLVVGGQAQSCADALALLQREPHDIVLLDLYLADGSGTDVLDEMKRRSIRTPVLILSSFGRDDNVFRALQAGARGYLLKSATADELFDAIRAVVRGEVWVSGELRDAIVRQVVRPNLTERERELLALLAQGRSNEEIGDRLHLSLGTVKTHIYRIMQKLEARSRTDAVARARQAGILPP